MKCRVQLFCGFFLLGYTVGYFLHIWMKKSPGKCEYNNKDFLLVAVKTSHKNLKYYGKYIMNTWGNNVPGQILFFIDNNQYNGSLPVINLDNIDEQTSSNVKKTFSVIHYLSEEYAQNYEWVLMIDEKTYVDLNRLEKILRRTDSNKGYRYIGKLMKDESYCQNSPGIILSSRTIRMLNQYIHQCYTDLPINSLTDDMVLGMCIEKYLQVTCTGSVEFNEMFISLPNEKYSPERIKDKTFIIHPVHYQTMYQWSGYFLARKIVADRIKSMDRLDEISKFQSVTSQVNDKNEKTNSSRYSNLDYWHRLDNPEPPFRLEPATIQAHNDALNAIETGKSLQHLRLLYMRYYRQSAGKNIENIFISKNSASKTLQSIRTYQTYTKPIVKFENAVNQTIWIILPVFKKVKEFKMFLQMCSISIAKFNGDVIIRVVLHKDENKDWMTNQNNLFVMKNNITFQLVLSDENFERGVAKDLGTKDLPYSALMVFMDVDMAFDEHFLKRVLVNTIEGTQTYFPIVFSQYDPRLVCYGKINCTIDITNVSNTHGLWRKYGFGMLSIYKNDYIRAGGFDKIKGWGLEDVNLCESCLKVGMQIFRSVDLSLVHIHHIKKCDPKLSSSQYVMCDSTKISHAGSTWDLYNFVMDIKE